MKTKRYLPQSVHWTEIVGGLAAFALVVGGFSVGGWVGAVALATVSACALAIWHVTFVSPPSAQPFERPMWWRGPTASTWRPSANADPATMSRGRGIFFALLGAFTFVVMLSAWSVAEGGVFHMLALGAALLLCAAGLFFVVRPNGNGRLPRA